MEIIALFAAIVFGLIGLYAARRYGTHRARLDVDLRTVRLVPIELNGKLVPMKPAVQYAVHILLANRSARDIGPGEFGDRPLEFSVSGAARVVTVASRNLAPPLQQSDPQTVTLPPWRIPVGTGWHWTMHVVGDDPFVAIHSPIHNVKVRAKVHRTTYGSALDIMGVGESGFRRGRWLKRSRVYYS